MKTKVEVLRPWNGVEAGQIIELPGPIPPILRSRVRRVGELVVAEQEDADKAPRGKGNGKGGRGNGKSNRIVVGEGGASDKLPPDDDDEEDPAGE